MLLKIDIRSIIKNRTSETIDIIENGEYLFYRKHLKEQIQKNEILKPIIPHFNNVLSLNKGIK
jgi:hypothetical protein